MNYLRDLIHRLRAGESEWCISRDMRISRITVHCYHELAQRQGFLEPGSSMPDDEAIRAALGETPRPPRITSSVEPYGEIVEQLLEQQLEMVAIFQRLRDDHGFRGSYSSVRRHVHRLRPPEPRVVVRVQTAPGEEAQVDFGPVGSLYDPVTDRLRPAYAFVATLSYSRHHYAELVFDRSWTDSPGKVPTWIALHRRAFQSWGGVPRRIVPDNLKAAVAHALVHDPVLGEAYPAAWPSTMAL